MLLLDILLLNIIYRKYALLKNGNPETSNKYISKAVAKFSEYSQEIRSAISHIAESQEINVKDPLFQGILNGNAALALQHLIPLEIRKEAGLFFTNNTIAEKVANCLAPKLRAGFRILDPACGAGNLLLACARHLPTGGNLDETLALWSNLILGYDLHAEFVRAAQLRLALLSLTFHQHEWRRISSIKPHEVFSGLKPANALTQPPIEGNICVVVNPPFGHTQAPSDCSWGTGRVQVAGVFLENLYYGLPEGVHLVAILPDVLRSGTRYQKWREKIASQCSSIRIELAGRFDSYTDVDVFIMHAVRGKGFSDECKWSNPDKPISKYNYTIADFFDICVGPVVPYRDPSSGSVYSYIHARTAPAWQIIDLISEKRGYGGKVFDSPFVVVHRTSSPNDKHRCVATIINSANPVAVENHLLILKPRDGSLESCKELLEVFKARYTDEWFNQRIRCRHLSVSALRELPCHKIGMNEI